MRIDHIALWSHDIERLKRFYCEYLGGQAGGKYENPSKGFQSYFVRFDDGARLELMQSQDVEGRAAGGFVQGFVHAAFSVGSRENVDRLTERLARDGYTVVSPCRTTGDGYYESCVADPDGNLIEITV